MKDAIVIVLVLLLLLLAFSISVAVFIDAAGDTLENIRIVVTATPTPTFEWYSGDCGGYCPTPCACPEF